MDKGTKVVVAMSGGVDSSVAAALLVEQGYDVTGVMLRLWSEPGKEESNRCCTPDAMAGARRVAARLGIPFYALNAQDLFRSTVVQAFMDGYRAGITPNPCILCNSHIRWGFHVSKPRGKWVLNLWRRVITPKSRVNRMAACNYYADMMRIKTNPT